MFMFKFRTLTVALTIAALGPPVVADDCTTGCGSGSGPVKLFRSISAGSPTLVRCEPTGTDFSFDISGWSGDNVLIISHCGTTLGSIGRVTITGSSASLTSLFVAVVSVSEDVGTLDQNDEELDPSCITFGGLLVSDAGTRAKTRASISVTGTIEHRGTDPAAADVEVNQIVRIQSDNAIDGNLHAIATGAFVGTTTTAIGQVRAGKAIAGSITAIALDNDFSDGAWAIGFIRAGNGITGTITAAGDPVRATPAPAFVAGIRTILVSPSTDPVPLGIRGEILAKYGAIGSIFTTGPIGSAGQPVQIIAGDGVFAVRARANSSSALAQVDFHVNLRAHDDILDHQDPDLSGCSSDCAVADFNGSGAVTVQDIFDFLAAYFNAGNCEPH